MVKVVGDVAVSMFAYLYCIMGLPEYCFPPHVSYKALGTLVFLFMSLLLQLVVSIYQCSHQQLYPFMV